jgi:hypothetical protein
MNIFYEGKEVPIHGRRQKDVDNQIIITRSVGKLRIKIILSAETCKGSIKPIVSVTNQIMSHIDDMKIERISDFTRYDLSKERILFLTINT